ncbi:hypothetical protein AB4Z48_36885 [Cupriavidus sp. 2TAF22]|uniref:hypothetical protein n=1 Tax=unclassified Cupriavidus TaxID=2640874 RepID=UPI003F905CE2
MLEVQQYEDRVYTTQELCDILRRGVDPEALAAWPLVALPEYVIAVARAEALTYPDVLDEAQRRRRGLRTEWGMLVVDLRWMPDDPAGWTLDVQVFLAEDPCLELTHLRRAPGETVRIFLSDLAKCVIEYGPAASAIERLREIGVSLADNDETGQAFALIGCDPPGRNLDFTALGGLLSAWLLQADVEGTLRAVRDPAVLLSVTEESRLPIIRVVLH